MREGTSLLEGEQMLSVCSASPQYVMQAAVVCTNLRSSGRRRPPAGPLSASPPAAHRIFIFYKAYSFFKRNVQIVLVFWG